MTDNHILSADKNNKNSAASRSHYSDQVIQEVFALLGKIPNRHISTVTQVPESTIRRWGNNPELIAMFGKSTLEVDKEIVEENIKLARKAQKSADTNRIERKAFREQNRAYNALEELTSSLIEIFSDRSFRLSTVEHKQTELDAPIGVIQLSDLHINCVIHDIDANLFNLDVACARLYKHVSKSITMFKANRVEKVLLALTGDLVKNIAHLSEISTNSMSRASATFVMVDIITQMVKQLNAEGFNVVIASVIGNESRATELVHEVNLLASDSFDLMIHNILTYALANNPGVTVLPMKNPLECVVNLHGTNLLMIHGNAHGRSANTSTIEKQTDIIKSQYAAKGIRIDYVICGHIHSAYISDKFARSGGLPGTDEYASRTLNLWGRASQNSYLFYKDGSIDGFKHDLQSTDGYGTYSYDKVCAALAIENNVRLGGVGHNTHISYNGKVFASYTV